MNAAPGVPTRMSWAAGSTAASAAAGRARLGRTAELIGIALAHGTRDGSLPDDLAARLATLPAAAMERLIAAPELYRQLICAKLGLSALSARYLERAITAEMLLAGELRSTDEPNVWTAAADAYVPPRRPWSGDPPEEHLGDAEWRADVPFRAPKLASVITLDFHAPRRRQLPGWGDGNTLMPNSAQVLPRTRQRLVGERLGQAYLGIGAVCPAAQALVRDCLVCIVIVADPRTSDTFYSGSNRIAVGRASLVNPDLPHVTVARLAEALVHEALHAYLYSHEWAGRWFVGAPRTWEVSVTSPWSDRKLPLVSFVHACFVWDALHGFWKRPAAAAVFGGAAREERLTQARRGLRPGAVVLALGDHAGILNPDLLQELRSLQRAWSAA